MLSADVRQNLIGPYAFAFFLVVLANKQLSELLKDGPIRTAYMVDHGFPYQDQLNRAHEMVTRFEGKLGEFRQTGPLAVDSDDRVPALFRRLMQSLGPLAKSK